ncbi:MAG: hypothetical protein AAF945_18305 [Actinomycetota bacterium]
MSGVLATVTGTASDPESTRIVYGVVVGLLAVGVLLVGLAIWLFRQTRPDPELLAPLDRMSSRSWRRLAPADRRRMLDAERPPGAQPLVPSRRAPAVSNEFDEVPAMATLDDLKQGAARAGDARPDDPLVIATTIADPATGTVLSTVEPDDSTGEVDDPVPTLFDPPSIADAAPVVDDVAVADVSAVVDDAPDPVSEAADDDSEVVR